MSGGAIPASTGRLLLFVGFKHPVIILQVSFSVASSFLHGWSVPIQGMHTLQLSSIALEQTTTVANIVIHKVNDTIMTIKIHSR